MRLHGRAAAAAGRCCSSTSTISCSTTCTATTAATTCCRRSRGAWSAACAHRYGAASAATSSPCCWKLDPERAHAERQARRDRPRPARRLNERSISTGCLPHHAEHRPHGVRHHARHRGGTAQAGRHGDVPGEGRGAQRGARLGAELAAPTRARPAEEGEGETTRQRAARPPGELPYLPRAPAPRLISGNAGPRRRRQNAHRRCAWRAAATDRECGGGSHEEGTRSTRDRPGVRPGWATWPTRHRLFCAHACHLTHVNHPRIARDREAGGQRQQREDPVVGRRSDYT